MFSERSVDVEGSRIRYTEGGDGTPLVVLSVADGGDWTTARDLLSRHFRVVAFDISAGGQPSQLAATVTRAISALGIETFDLLGSSYGSETAVSLALSDATRVRTLVLEAPTLIRPESGRDADVELRLRSVSMPALVLFGTVDQVSSPGMGPRYKDLIPACHLVYVYDAGHAISADRPEAFADVVVDFLQRHDAFVISRTATVIHP